MSAAEDFLTIRTRVFHDVAAEAARGEGLHGNDNPTGGDPELATLANAVRRIVDIKTEAGVVRFADIAAEEFLEALSEPDPQLRRQELIQLAAVVVRWAEALDREAGVMDGKGVKAKAWWKNTFAKRKKERKNSCNGE